MKTIIIATGAALLAGAAAVAAVLTGGFIAGALAAGAAAGSLGVIIAREKATGTDPQLLQRAATQAESGRKLAIYERDTGFLAYWYLELRCMEECYRAVRYSHPLALMVVEPSPGHDEWTVQGEIAGLLRSSAREADLISYTGNGRFVAVMPETTRNGANKLAGRLRKGLPTIDVAVSAYPENGETLSDLLQAAVLQLDSASAASMPSHRIDRVA
jgi:hypothetical protein